MKISRLIGILEDWSSWMKKDNHRLGYPNKTSYFSTGGESTSEVFNDMVSQSDSENVKIINSIIDDLPNPQKVCIYYEYLGGLKPLFYERNINLAMDNLLTLSSAKIYA